MHRRLRSAVFALLVASPLLLLGGGEAVAQQKVVLDFSGLKQGEAVGQYYAGGKGSLGTGPGPNHHVTFTPANGANVSTTLVNGQSLLFMANLNKEDLESMTMSVATGFKGELSFLYAATLDPGGSVTIYDGPDGTGKVLATRTLVRAPGNPLYNASSNPPVVIAFEGTARSVVFTLVGGAAGLYNITFMPARAVKSAPANKAQPGSKPRRRGK